MNFVAIISVCLISLSSLIEPATAGYLKEIKEFKKFVKMFVDTDTIWDRLKVCKFSKSDYKCKVYCTLNSVPRLQPYCTGVCQGFWAELCTCIYCPVTIDTHAKGPPEEHPYH